MAIRQALQRFFEMETAGGILLLSAAALGLVLANAPLGGLYQAFLDMPVAIQVGRLQIAKPMLLWVNDGLMAVFFFQVGLEIKREFLEGELHSPSRIVLPALCALGGMLAPALIYVVLNRDDAEHLNGWAIPTATDIAFALGILALVGSRAPPALKVLLTAIAIMDDLGAILIIALFYTQQLVIGGLLAGVAALMILVLLNRARVMRTGPYVVVGIVLWTCVLKSGVHATLAGVITAFAIPLSATDAGGEAPLPRIENALRPWVEFGILPLFAFANAGVSLAGLGFDALLRPVRLGIALGLFVGKQVGVFAMAWLAVRTGLASMPTNTNWRQLYAGSVLCGIGFTMSLFIGSLAFEHSDFDAPIRLGVLMGSVASAIMGFLLLKSGDSRR